MTPREKGLALVVIAAVAVVAASWPLATHCWIGTAYPRVETSLPVVALTFDDGPYPPFTGQILEILERHGIRATFFMVGMAVEQFPDAARAVLQRGHELANHSFSHPRLWLHSPGGIKDEILRCDRALRAIGYKEQILVRPPFLMLYWVLPYVLWREARTAILADVTPDDVFEGDPEVVAQRVLSQVRPGSIIMLHDGGLNPGTTVAAIERISSGLQAKGYRFVTVSELLRLDPQKAGR